MITSCQIFVDEFIANGIFSTALYSHIVPVSFALLLGVYIAFKTKFTPIATVFLAFAGAFSLWLLGDLITWTVPSYSFITFAWSWLDYLNIVFFVLGGYFFLLLARGSARPLEKMLLLGLCVPAFAMAVLGYSITGFDQPVCEALNNGFLTTYKIVVEWIVIIMMLASLATTWRGIDRKKRTQLVFVCAAILLFFSSFSVAEYIASNTGVYEVSLYSLFVLPVFLIIMVFAITNLQVFSLRFLGIQLLIYILIIMVGSQFLFLQSSTDRNLNILTLVGSVLLGYLLLRNAKNEDKAREKIEKLAGDLKKANVRLTELDRQKSEFVSFATHQLRSPLTAMKGYASLILEGEMGPVEPQAREAVSRIFESTNTLASIVDDYLNVTRIELGSMKYAFETIDFKTLVEDVIGELKPNIDKSVNVKFSFSAENSGTDYRTTADRDKLKQVIANLIDNSLKYTPKGSVAVTLGLDRVRHKFIFKIQDTGIGIAPETLPHLFAKWSRAGNANKTNIRGTGLGLFVAKEIIVAHHGDIYAKSEGEGKGSAFIVELEPFAKA